jgi:hypothetical protein
MNAGGMPLLFSALERHNTSYKVVIGALSGIHHIVSEEGFSSMYFSDHPECFRIIEDAERTMARLYPDATYVGHQASLISLMLMFRS